MTTTSANETENKKKNHSDSWVMKVIKIKIAIFACLFFLVLIWPEPTLSWKTVEQMATDYMDLCNEITPFLDDSEDSHKKGKIFESTAEYSTVSFDSYPSKTPLEGITVVITGATSGIGQSLVRVLHKLGSTVVVIGRSSKKLEQLKDEFDRNDKIITVLGDNSDLESISTAADEIISKFNKIDFLINNAGIHYHGIQNPLFSKKSNEGYDWLFTVNYLSHFLLTQKLLPLLEKSSHKPRIIQISSSYHWKVDGSDLMVSNMDMSKLTTIAPRASRFDIRTTEQCARSYANSKFAQILHMRALSRRLSSSPTLNKVSIVSVCPSWVVTHISDGQGFMQALIHKFGLRSDGPGIRSILNAMFIRRAGDDSTENRNDFIINTHGFVKWAISLRFLLVFPRLRDVWSDFFLCIPIPFQNIIHDDYITAKSAPETYNINLQESLFVWSSAVVKKWID